jgi:hypothetical protein
MKKAVVAAVLVASMNAAFAGYTFEAAPESQSRPHTQTVSEERQAAMEYFNSLKGKTFWIVPNPRAKARVNFFDNLDTIKDTSGPNDSAGSFHPDTESSFVVSKIYPWVFDKDSTKTDRYFAKVTFEDGQVGYVDAKETFGYTQAGGLLDPAERYAFNEYVFSSKPAVEHTKVAGKPAAKVAKKEPPKSGVRIGMTQADVLVSAWGKPRSVNRTITAAGTEEQWVYGGRNYLYFKDGILRAIQN